MTTMTKEKNPLIAQTLNAIRKLGLSRAHAYFERLGETDEAVCSLSFTNEEKGIESKATIEGIPARIHAGHTDAVETHTYDGRSYERYSEAYKPRRGSWCLFYCEELLSALEALPSHAEFRLDVNLDSGTNQYLTDARLHCDRLYLTADWTNGRKRVRRRFLLCSTSGAHNTARFGVYR